MLAALDPATGKLYYRIRPRKRWRGFLGLLKILRTRWPGEKLYVVLDNFSPHKHAKVRAWAADNDIELVFLPTYGSWLNWTRPSSRSCTTSPSTVPTIAATPSRTRPSPPTSAGAMPAPSRRRPSRPTHRSVHGLITPPRLRDEPLARGCWRDQPPEERAASVLRVHLKAEHAGCYAAAGEPRRPQRWARRR
ncbi:transposase [Streptomyces sp. KR55]|uniref:transposase n=1 Tax=Streptomyces sp. KR55 TaxID=3457425 RepID=UPI003FD60385